MTMVSFKVVKRNKYGVKWIEEPPQRFEFREKCKYQGKVGNCEKQYYAEGYDERNKQKRRISYGKSSGRDKRRASHTDERQGDI